MGEFVRTADLAALIERHNPYRTYGILSAVVGVSERRIYGIRKSEYEFTTLRVADRILTRLGLSVDNELEVISRARPENGVVSARRDPVLREKYLANPEVHGRLSTYTSYKCRCPKCTAANTQYYRELRARRRNAVSDETW